MTEVEVENEVWESLSEPASAPFSERKNELTGLVHYTSFAGLQGIIQNEELWFSPVASMNDYDEVVGGKEKLQKLSSVEGHPLRKIINELSEEGAKAEIDFKQVYSISQNSDLFETFISCWSICDLQKQSHDNLSMWRGYSSEGNGAALIIDPKDLGLNSLFSSHVVVYPVFYENETEFVERAMKSFAHFLKNMRAFETNVLKNNKEIVSQAFADLCFQLAISHKHPGFVAEKEWRFVWRRHREFEDRFFSYVRPQVGARGMYEYFCLPIKTDNGVSPMKLDIRNLIKEIMIGPTDDAYLKQQATKTLLKQLGFDLAKTKVTQSDIPYRAM